MGKHVKILYCISNPNQTERINNLKQLVDDSMLEFDPYQVKSRNKLILELQSIIDNFKKLIGQKGKIPVPISPETQQTSNQIEKKNTSCFEKNERLMSKCFCKSYSEIMQAFMCLEKERTLEESQDIDIDDCIWLILYCITWFFVYRISSDNCHWL